MSKCRVLSCDISRGCLLWPVHSLGKIASLCPASFCTPRPNLPVTSGIFWLPTFVFQSPIMKRTSFLGVSSRRSCRTIQLQLLQHYWLGHRLGLLWYWMVCHWQRTDIICCFETASKYCISDFFVDYEGYSISSKGFFPTVVDLMRQGSLVGCCLWGRTESDTTEAT